MGSTDGPFPWTSISGGKAQNLQPRSLEALLSSLSTAGIFLGITVGASVLIRLGPQSSSIFHPRQHFFSNTRVAKLPRNPFLAIISLIQTRDSTIVHDCGTEAVLFLQYLQSLSLNFGIMALLVTPSLACFTHLQRDRSENEDWLNTLTWSSLSTKNAKLYWFYAFLVPMVVGNLLFMISWQVDKGLTLLCGSHSTLDITDENEPPSSYFVAISNIPASTDAEQIRRHYAAWNEHITNITFTRDVSSELTNLSSLAQRIERRETAFILDICQQLRQKNGNVLPVQTLRQIALRYAKIESSLMPWKSSNIYELYQQLGHSLEALTAKVHETESKATCQSVILSVDNYHTACMIEACPQSFDILNYRTRYLGFDTLDVLVANICQPWSTTEFRRTAVQCLMITVIFTSTLPMAAIGTSSQLDALLQVMSTRSGTVLPTWSVALMQGVIPSLATSVLMSLFPWILRMVLWSARYLVTTSELEHAIYEYYFAFLYLQLLIVPSIISGLIPTALAVLDGNIWELPRILARNLPLAGNYFLSYILISTILQLGSTIFRIQTLLKHCWGRRSDMTPRDRLTSLESLMTDIYWGDFYPFYSIIATIGITFSLLTPLILPIAFIAFGTASLCFRYSLLYSSNIRVETYGKLYFLAVFSTFCGIYTLQITFIGLFVLKFDPRNKAQDLAQLLILVLTLITTRQFQIRFKKLYQPWLQHQHMPRPRSLRSTKERLASHVEPKFGSVYAVEWKEFVTAGVTIWLPEDRHGISTQLIKQVTSLFGERLAAVHITDANAHLSDGGSVELCPTTSNATSD